MKAHYLVCYDIAKPERLARVLRLMKGKGIHLQYSVFFCSLTWPELAELKEDLRNRIKEKEDDIRIYPLPVKAVISTMGCGDKVPDGVELFIE